MYNCTVHKKAILFIYLLLMISSMEIYNNNQRLSLNTCLLFSAVGQNESRSLSLLPNMWRIDQQHFQRLEIRWFNVQHYIPLNTLSSKVDKKKMHLQRTMFSTGQLDHSLSLWLRSMSKLFLSVKLIILTGDNSDLQTLSEIINIIGHKGDTRQIRQED